MSSFVVEMYDWQSEQSLYLMSQAVMANIIGDITIAKTFSILKFYQKWVDLTHCNHCEFCQGSMRLQQRDCCSFRSNWILWLTLSTAIFQCWKLQKAQNQFHVTYLLLYIPFPKKFRCAGLGLLWLVGELLPVWALRGNWKSLNLTDGYQ